MFVHYSCQRLVTHVNNFNLPRARRRAQQNGIARTVLDERARYRGNPAYAAARCVHLVEPDDGDGVCFACVIAIVHRCAKINLLRFTTRATRRGINHFGIIQPARQVADAPVDFTQALFAIVLDDSAVDIVEVADEGGLIDTRKFVVPGRNDLFVHDLRAMATEGTVPVDIIGILGQAKSIMHWHARHRFCSNCGSSSELAAAGWRRECRVCKAMHFPRTDPVVIMLAISGEDCLMGRAGRFGKHMYSALAGFLEPGETMEDAVRREIREESGIRVGRVAYLASQPWPFPASLMIGCVAEALNRDIVIDHNELEDCRWFSRRDVQMMLKREHPDGYTAPHPLAIAHHLLRAWSEGRTPKF